MLIVECDIIIVIYGNISDEERTLKGTTLTHLYIIYIGLQQYIIVLMKIIVFCLFLNCHMMIH